MKKSRILSLCGASACGVLASFAFSSPAKADVASDIALVTDVANLLGGIVTVMTGVVVAPMGISAAAKTFRHVVIANV
jgi:hypothetical protein